MPLVKTYYGKIWYNSVSLYAKGLSEREPLNDLNLTWFRQEEAMNLSNPYLQIGRLVRNLRISVGMAQHELAKKIEINNSYLSRIENGERRPSPKIMKRMAAILPTSYEELVQASGLISDGFAVVPVNTRAYSLDIIKTLDELKAKIAPFERSVPKLHSDGFGSQPLVKRRAVPIFDRIPAGFFDEANVVRDFDYIEHIVLAEEELGYDPHAFALRVKGDSMIEAGILEDDIVIVSPGTEVKNGDIAAVSYGNVDITLKKFHNFGDMIVLQPCNSTYPPVTIANLDEVKVLGRVILVRRKLL